MFQFTHLYLIVAFVMLSSSPLRAQSAGQRVVVTGQVSGVAAVTLGSVERLAGNDVQVSAVKAGHDLVLSLSGARGGETSLELPIQLRSNAEFALTASCATSAAKLSALSVVEVDGAGPFVHAGAAARVRTHADGARDFSSPVTILTAPPISMAGTLDSPGNMIEVKLRVVISPQDGEQGWRVEVKLAPARLRGGD